MKDIAVFAIAVAGSFVVASAANTVSAVPTQFNLSSGPLYDYPSGGGNVSDPPLLLSGSLTVPVLNPGLLSPTFTFGLTNINLIVLSGGAILDSFTNPTLVEYTSGIGANGNYFVDLYQFGNPFLGLTLEGPTIADVNSWGATFDDENFSTHGYTGGGAATIDEPASPGALALSAVIILGRLQRRRGGPRIGRCRRPVAKILDTVEKIGRAGLRSIPFM